MPHQKQEKTTCHCDTEPLRLCLSFLKSCQRFCFSASPLLVPQPPVRSAKNWNTELRPGCSSGRPTRNARLWDPTSFPSPWLDDGRGQRQPVQPLGMKSVTGSSKRLNILTEAFCRDRYRDSHWCPCSSLEAHDGLESLTGLSEPCRGLCPHRPRPSPEVRGEGVTFLRSVRHGLRSAAGCQPWRTWPCSNTARVTRPPPSSSSRCSQMSPLAILAPSAGARATLTNTAHLPQPLRRSPIFRHFLSNLGPLPSFLQTPVRICCRHLPRVCDQQYSETWRCEVGQEDTAAAKLQKEIHNSALLAGACFLT